MPRPCARCCPAPAIHGLRLRRPGRLASSSCGRHKYSRRTRQTDRQTSDVRQHRCLMPPPTGRWGITREICHFVLSNFLAHDITYRVTCDVGYLCANFSLPRPLCSRLKFDVRDRQTDRRQTRIIALCPRYGGGSIITKCQISFYASAPAPRRRGH